MDNNQLECPNCRTQFPTTFSDSISGDAELIVHDGELSAIIEFNCPVCDAPLVLEDARGPSFGVNPQR